LGLTQVEYVGHIISAEGTSFTEEKRLKVLNFPLPQTKKALLQFLRLRNYFREHVPNMTELCKPLRGMCPTDETYKSNRKLEWTPERIRAFEVCQQAIYVMTNGKVRVIRYFSKALQGAQLNWSAREKECYGIYYGKDFHLMLLRQAFTMARNVTTRIFI